MYIVHVHVHVKAELIEAFKKATIENASNSVEEAGIARFDVIQRADVERTVGSVVNTKPARLTCIIALLLTDGAIPLAAQLILGGFVLVFHQS